jgi:hypothetical protein
MVKVWSAGPGVVAQSKAPSTYFPSDDPPTDLFFVLLVALIAPLLFERFRRLLGRYLTGRLVGHVCPLSSLLAYSLDARPERKHDVQAGWVAIWGQSGAPVNLL